MKKKLLSLLLCLSFVLALVPTAMAVDTDTDPQICTIRWAVNPPAAKSRISL